MRNRLHLIFLFVSFKIIYYFIYLLLVALGLCCFARAFRLSVVEEIVGHTPVAVCVLLIVMDFLVEKYGLWDT